MNDSVQASATNLPTSNDISNRLGKEHIVKEVEKQNKLVQKALGRSIVLSAPNFDSHKNRHLVNSKKCGRSRVILSSLSRIIDILMRVKGKIDFEYFR